MPKGKIKVPSGYLPLLMRESKEFALALRVAKNPEKDALLFTPRYILIKEEIIQNKRNFYNLASIKGVSKLSKQERRELVETVYYSNCKNKAIISFFDICGKSPYYEGKTHYLCK